MEVNDFIFGLMLLIILFESVLIIGICTRNNENQEKKHQKFKIDIAILPYFIVAIFCGILGFGLMFFSQMSDPKYGVGVAFVALAYTIIFYVLQEKSNKEILDSIRGLEESFNKK